MEPGYNKLGAVLELFHQSGALPSQHPAGQSGKRQILNILLPAVFLSWLMGLQSAL